MNYRELDMRTHPRAAHFAYFSAMHDPYVGVTVDTEIGDLPEKCRQMGLPFFLTFLYCAGRAANAVSELRQRIQGERVLEFDRCDTSHTVLREDGTYRYCRVDCMKPFEEYLPQARERHEAAKTQDGLDDGEDARSLLYVSCVPWLRYDALRQPVPSPADSNPRITWGRYVTERGRSHLPVTLLANHALVDGLHIGAFYDALQVQLEEMTRLAREAF